MKTFILASVFAFTSLAFAKNDPAPLDMNVFTDSIFPALDLHCGGCHGASGVGEQFTGGPDSGLSFPDAQTAYERLMMPSFGDEGATMRVVAGDPDASSFYNKIIASSEEVWYGDPMPQGWAWINDYPDEVEAVRQWIAAGAKEPTPVNDRLKSQAKLFTYQVNASRGLIQFQAKGPIVELGVYDAVGKLVQEMHNMGSSLSLSYNQWQGGIYFVKIRTANKSEIQKLILH